MFFVTDRNDKDRSDFIIDQFETREAAEAFAEEFRREWGTCQIEEAESEEDIRGE